MEKKANYKNTNFELLPIRNNEADKEDKKSDNFKISFVYDIGRIFNLTPVYKKCTGEGVVKKGY